MEGRQGRAPCPGAAMIGREKEKKILQDCLNSKRPEFLAVYGRRRVGKTYLIRNFFREHFSFYTTGVAKLNTRQQLRVFHEALQKYGDESRAMPADWLEAFSRLEKLLSRPDVPREYQSGKRVVFLDELPWMDTARSGFRSALDYFWNSWASTQNDLIFIVCGSATSWIINHIVKDTGGFYNRITRQIRLMPFCLSECEQLLASNGMHMTRKQIIECYMILGGIPYYLNYLVPQLSLSQNIDMLFFQENGPLRYEYHQLFSSLFKNAANHIKIIEALSTKRSGLTRMELLSCGNIPDGKELTKCLDELEQCGFIRRYADRFERIAVGRPLLFTAEDRDAVAHLMPQLCLGDSEEDRALLLMGHGSEKHPVPVYEELQESFAKAGIRNVFVGTVEGTPSFEDAKALLDGSGYKKVVLAPLMIVAGDHAVNDLAGEEDSWKSILVGEGYQTEVILAGLGEYEQMQNLFAEHAAQAESI